MAPKGRGGKGKGKGKQQTHRKTSASNPAASASSPVAASSPFAAASTSVGRVFPSNVIFDILSRLPVKSLLRFRCASNHWRTLVTQPAFVSAHLRRSPATLLINAIRTPAPDVDGVPQPQQPSGHAIYAYGPPNPQSGQPSTLDRILDFAQPMDVFGTTPNGVVCIVQQPFAQKFILWNPATRSSQNLPPPGIHYPSDIMGVSAGLGFDPSTNEYTIIRIARIVQSPCPLPDVVQLFNFQTGRWARIDNGEDGTVLFRVATGACEAVVNGVPYWRAWEYDDDIVRRLKLVWFDVRRSVFDSEWFPWSLENREMEMGEIWAGCLGAMVWDQAEPASVDPVLIDVWTREPENGEWYQTYRVDRQELPVVGRLVGFHGDGGIVQEIVTCDETPVLCMIMLATDDGDVATTVQDYCRLDGACPGTCKLVRYRESLTRLPRIG